MEVVKLVMQVNEWNLWYLFPTYFWHFFAAALIFSVISGISLSCQQCIFQRFTAFCASQLRKSASFVCCNQRHSAYVCRNLRCHEHASFSGHPLFFGSQPLFCCRASLQWIGKFEREWELHGCCFRNLLAHQLML